MAILFFSGLNTITETYPNYYRNVAIFTFVYVFLLKVNEALINYRNKKHAEAVSTNEPSWVLKALIKINETSTGMHIASCLSVISFISAWNLLLLDSGYSAMLFVILGVSIPLGIMMAEST
jgi:hypothetical protein